MRAHAPGSLAGSLGDLRTLLLQIGVKGRFDSTDGTVTQFPCIGSVKLAAAWMIDACGWKGKTVGQAGVYERQALVLVNRGAAIGSEVMTLSRAIQESVSGRFGIRLEHEPGVV